MEGFVLRKVLVTGSRNHTDRKLIWDALDEFRGDDDEVVVIQGGARGADYLAKQWATHNSQPHATFPANWVRYSRAAGSRRNRQMFWTLDPELVLAFPLSDSIGTWDMVAVARDSGTLVEVKYS